MPHSLVRIMPQDSAVSKLVPAESSRCIQVQTSAAGGYTINRCFNRQNLNWSSGSTEQRLTGQSWQDCSKNGQNCPEQSQVWWKLAGLHSSVIGTAQTGQNFLSFPFQTGQNWPDPSQVMPRLPEPKISLVKTDQSEVEHCENWPDQSRVVKPVLNRSKLLNQLLMRKSINMHAEMGLPQSWLSIGADKSMTNCITLLHTASHMRHTCVTLRHTYVGTFTLHSTP